MFSFSEMIFILALLLVVVGPRQIPELARKIGRFMGEMKRATEGLAAEFRDPGHHVKNEIKEIVKIADVKATDKVSGPNPNG